MQLALEMRFADRGVEMSMWMVMAWCHATWLPRCRRSCWCPAGRRLSWYYVIRLLSQLNFKLYHRKIIVVAVKPFPKGCHSKYTYSLNPQAAEGLNRYANYKPPLSVQTHSKRSLIQDVRRRIYDGCSCFPASTVKIKLIRICPINRTLPMMRWTIGSCLCNLSLMLLFAGIRLWLWWWWQWCRRRCRWRCWKSVLQSER